MGDPTPRVCFFGTFDLGRHPRGQVLMDGLAARGWQVAVQNVPWHLDTHGRVAVIRQPWRIAPTLLALMAAWRRLWLLARRGPSFDVVIVVYFGYFDIHLARRTHPDAVLVLDDLAPLVGTTVDRGLDVGWRRSIISGVERAALAAADLVMVDTAEHERRATPSVVVAVGASREWFGARHVHRAQEESLRVVFFGLFTPLQGVPVIADAIRLLRQDVHVTLVGTGQDHDRVRQRLDGLASVRHRDWIDSSSLPAVVAEHDVCLGIFGTTAKAHRVVPNKVFQGMAAGCAVVTSDTAPQRRALGDAAVLVPPGDPESLALALDDLAADRRLLEQLRRRACALADQHFTGEQIVAGLDERLREETRR